MKLSVIIPLYNSEKYVSKCLDSLVNQNISEDIYEIVIVNDGSKDNSLLVAEEYAQKYSNITIYSQENKGVAAARNQGVIKANGEFIFFVDSDDYLALNTFETIIKELEKDIDLLTFISIQTSRTDLDDTQKNEVNVVSEEIIDGTDFIAKYGFKDAIGWFIIRKEFLVKENMVYLEGKMLEDISFNIKLLTIVNKVLYLPLDVYRYVSRENSIMTKKNALHFKNIISDYERVLLELETQIQKFSSTKINVVNQLRKKQNIYHFYLFMRLMRSSMSITEINKNINHYKKIKLHPLRYYSKSIKVKSLIFIFNKKFFFFPFIRVYRLFSKRAI